MFERYYKRKVIVIRRRVERDMVAVIAVIAIFTAAGATALQLSIGNGSTGTPPVGNASVRIVERDSAEVVGPLVNYPLAELAVTVSGTPLRLRSLSFMLDGVYDIGAIQGVALNLDGVQAGLPQLPNEEGVVSFAINTAVLEPGNHSLVFALHAPHAVPGSVFLARFDPGTSFSLSSADGTDAPLTAQLPYAGSTVTVAAQGTVSGFARTGAPLHDLYLYARGEDFRARGITFESSGDLTGEVFHVFIDDRFAGVVAFQGTESRLSVADQFIRIVPGRNTAVRVAPERVREADRGVIAREIEVLGLRSGQISTFPLGISLAP